MNMENTKTIDILKQAILLEKRGKAFYQNAAENAKDPDVKKVFEIMAEEEEDHVRFLAQQYKKYQSDGKFDPSVVEQHSGITVADTVFSKSLTSKISAASFEAAAIASAIDMENRAIAAYSERAENAEDEDEKKFYQWLADWEKGHHKLLFKLDEELKEKIWFDNNFWPF
jgi:rubrerythrin